MPEQENNTALDNYNAEIWRQHPEEVDDSYYFFFYYYLKMPRGGRTVKSAYTQFLMTDRGLSEKEAKKKALSSYYHNWSNGRTKMGEDIPTLHTFEERATAYDNWIMADEVNKLMSRRSRVVNREYNDTQTLLGIWEQLLGDAEADYQFDKQQSEEKGTAFNPKPHISRLKDLTRIRDEIAVQTRRTVGMKDKVTEDTFAKSQIQENTGVEWVEPEIKRPAELSDEQREIDEMSMEDFEAMLMEGKEERLSIDE